MMSLATSMSLMRKSSRPLKFGTTMSWLNSMVIFPSLVISEIYISTGRISSLVSLFACKFEKTWLVASGLALFCHSGLQGPMTTAPDESFLGAWDRASSSSSAERGFDSRILGFFGGVNINTGGAATGSGSGSGSSIISSMTGGGKLGTNTSGRAMFI